MDDLSARYTDNPALKFSDISSEAYRTYEFPNGHIVTVNNPEALLTKVASPAVTVGAPHTHKVVDITGLVHYIPAGWVRLTWRKKDGAKAVAF